MKHTTFDSGKLSQRQWGLLGAIESHTQEVWRTHGVDVHPDLARASRKDLRLMANQLLKRSGGRPNKHDAKTLRSSRPKEERLQPYDSSWPARAPVPY